MSLFCDLIVFTEKRLILVDKVQEEDSCKSMSLSHFNSISLWKVRHIDL